MILYNITDKVILYYVSIVTLYNITDKVILYYVSIVTLYNITDKVSYTKLDMVVINVSTIHICYHGIKIVLLQLQLTSAISLLEVIGWGFWECSINHHNTFLWHFSTLNCPSILCLYVVYF